MNTTVLIVYATDWGNTKKMAEAVAEGAEEVPETTVLLKEAENVTLEETAACDALIMGTPVHMGSPDHRIKQYIDKICSKLWMENKMNGKVGGVFATGSGFGNGGGGCELTMLALLNNMAELGMVLIPLPKNTPGYAVGGLQWGPYARSMGENMEQTGISDAQLEAAHHHGLHIARAAHIMKGQELF